MLPSCPIWYKWAVSSRLILIKNWWSLSSWISQVQSLLARFPMPVCPAPSCCTPPTPVFLKPQLQQLAQRSSPWKTPLSSILFFGSLLVLVHLHPCPSSITFSLAKLSLANQRKTEKSDTFTIKSWRIIAICSQLVKIFLYFKRGHLEISTSKTNF